VPTPQAGPELVAPLSAAGNPRISRIP